MEDNIKEQMQALHRAGCNIQQLYERNTVFPLIIAPGAQTNF